jgi:hypothetical protein
MIAHQQREFERLIRTTASHRRFMGGGWVQPLPNGSWAAYDGVRHHWCDDEQEALAAARR